MDGKASLDIIDKTEELTGLLNGDDIYMYKKVSLIKRKKYDQITHEAGRIVRVGTDFTVDLDEPLHDDFGHISVVQSVLETVSEENNEGKRFPKFVRACAGSGGENTAQFVQHP